MALECKENENEIKPVKTTKALNLTPSSPLISRELCGTLQQSGAYEKLEDAILLLVSPRRYDRRRSSSIEERHIVKTFLDTLPLREHEHTSLMALHEWVMHDDLSQRIAEETTFGDLILSFFSSFSKNNPDDRGCWTRWVEFRLEYPLKDVPYHCIRDFFNTQVFSVGWDRWGHPVWFINVELLNPDEFNEEVVAKSTLLWLTSLLWNLSTNEFDFEALRHGISVYIDLKKWSWGQLRWNLIKIMKGALIAYPFQLVNIFFANTPQFLYMLRSVAERVFVRHALDKFRVLQNPEEWFEKYGTPEHTPIFAGGQLNTTACEWLTTRGFLEDVDNN